MNRKTKKYDKYIVASYLYPLKFCLLDSTKFIVILSWWAKLIFKFDIKVRVSLYECDLCLDIVINMF